MIATRPLSTNPRALESSGVYETVGAGGVVEFQYLDEEQGDFGSGLEVRYYRFSGHPSVEIRPGLDASIRGLRISANRSSPGRWEKTSAILQLETFSWLWQIKLFRRGWLRGSYLLLSLGAGFGQERIVGTFVADQSAAGSVVKVQDDFATYSAQVGVRKAWRLSKSFGLDVSIRYEPLYERVFVYAPGRMVLDLISLGVGIRYIVSEEGK